MNRLEKRFEVWGEDCHGELLNICLWFRMSLNGSADPLSEDEEKRYISFLKCVLETWEDSHMNDLEKEFDDSVKAIVYTTMNMYYSHQKELRNFGLI